ncbi:FtsK/SpoIIIE domain-containing protein [Zavarzinella formosa]|uniref:FtsK/SpoIIIE domain-containing protein n=1 Tax=Zavarzinella formosa TaxID=360055 RepID=UPI0002DEDC8D|nr:FtsK/SpoIIIE domain-containing protein [Zavarzinella formosa]
MSSASPSPLNHQQKMNLFELERAALRELLTLLAHRAERETAMTAERNQSLSASEREFARNTKTQTAQRDRELAQIETNFQAATQEISQRGKQELDEAEHEYNKKKKAITEQHDDTEQGARAQLQDSRWTADSMFEAAEKQANDDLDLNKRKAAHTLERVEKSWTQAEPILERIQEERGELEQKPPTGEVIVDPYQLIEQNFQQTTAILKNLEQSKTLKYSGAAGFFIILVPFALIGAIPSVFVDPKWLAILGGSVVAAGFAFVTHWLLRKAAFNHVRLQLLTFAALLAQNVQARSTLLRRAEQEHEHRMGNARVLRESARTHAMAEYETTIAAVNEERRTELGNVVDRYSRTREKIRQWREDATDKAEAHFGGDKTECEQKHSAILGEIERIHKDKKKTATALFAAHEQELSLQWRDGQERIGRAITKLRANGLEHFPDWNSPFWYSPPAAIRVPTGIRFGDFDIDLTQLPGGVPEDEDEMPTLPVRLKLPAFLPFPDRCSLLLKAKDQGRVRGVQSIQAIMLRLLTAIPPGKLRFTIVDPVGLGENFAAFMHLADYDEQLVGSRIWTETAQIEKRLADLTAHMETVIQKYLRNQYRSIEEYNAQAGEVAEPFRVLVVANFPANFSLEACRRLVSIVNSGPSCGVYTLVTHDPKHPVPQGFNLADLEQASINLVWKDKSFTWKDPDFAPFPLQLETPPSLDEITRLVRLVGERSKNANRVEVNFDFVGPKPIEVWASDSRYGISVAIGRAGATKRQYMELGRGTAQHALIAGKTGSGKSTLLHALITNLALNYSPSEVELYLIDFKKGVEFKAYASNRLPHAKAVAIESEREFGMSVLQRLDNVLKERGETFRLAGVNSVGEYRDWQDGQRKNHGTETAPMPRIMLIVDEFQEFFVEDDRLAQESALLLDRLVRQGRAFGLHVVLGSQTLGGAYSLARSTIDQMAVRIALQCSEADAQLILNKDNTGARLLTRPGEAIYNDANGLVEGNDLFQVVWLADEKREKILSEIRIKADNLGQEAKTPLVFEGNSSADILKNVRLRELLDAPVYPAAIRSTSFWLGDAIAIKDPTAASFRPMNGNNLLMIGQDETLAVQLMSMGMLSLGLQHAPNAVKFFMFDGTPDDAVTAGTMGRIVNALPHDIQMLDRNALAPALTALGNEVTARQKGESADRTPCFLFINGIQWFRELRKEDDYGFGRRGAERTLSAAENLLTILRDGPLYQVFTIVWADTPANLGRSIDRGGQREFGQRVLFQMSANDSSTLIDTPAASRLGKNRALYTTEEMPYPEKFRPYGLPTREWLQTVRQILGRRVLPNPNASSSTPQ